MVQCLISFFVSYGTNLMMMFWYLSHRQADNALTSLCMHIIRQRLCCSQHDVMPSTEHQIKLYVPVSHELTCALHSLHAG